MTAPNPGPGWTALAADAPIPDGAEVLTWAAAHPGQILRWTLTPPPALPTAIGSTIRIEGVVWTLESMGWRAAGADTVTAASDLTPPTFDVLAVPQAQTAAAVLADVVSQGITSAGDLTAIAQRYGVALPAER